MTIAPDTTERLARARGDLRMGVPAVLTLNSGDGALVLAAETITTERLSGVVALGSDACLAITGRRAETLRARAYDGDLARIALPPNAGAEWVKATADPADDLRHPMKGPFETLRGGDASIHRAAIALTKSARLLPAAILVQLNDATEIAAAHNLTALPAAAALETNPSPLSQIVSARLPLEVAEAGRLHVFRPDDGGEEHYAVEIGTPDRSQPVLARLHSACFTGDLLGSLKCDCGPQLRAALAQMGSEGAGILLYLNQEGRGIGLLNKIRAYHLQDQGADTVEANERLGFAADLRDYSMCKDMLEHLGIKSLRLMTNNPRKVKALSSYGIAIAERVPLHVGRNPHNEHYLDTKQS